MPHETDFWAEEWPQHSRVQRGLRRFKQQFNYRLESHFLDVIDDFRPDIVHTHSLVDVSTRVWLAAKARSRPIVHTLRDYDLFCANAAMFKSGASCSARHMKCRVFTFMKSIHHHSVDAVVGVGAEILATHLKLGFFRNIPDRLRRVIWNPAAVEGIGPGYSKPSLEGMPFTFGYLGRINVEKGVGTLLSACRKLPQSGWRLLVAGKEISDGTSLAQSAAGLPVSFLGFLPPREFLEQIDVLVVPSIWAEPLPRSILEAYAAQVPVIGANSGGIPDLIGAENANWLFPPGNAEALSCRMRASIQAGRTGLPPPAAYKQVVDRTAPSAVAQRYAELYEEVFRR
jgi:glycosyltransferase involved in cell wall biosynthesis